MSLRKDLVSVVNWLLIGRVLVVSGSPCSFCCGGRGGERDLGNEVKMGHLLG